MVWTIGTAAAQSAPAACASFVGDMSQRWSIEGYSSLQNAVQIEGGDWFWQTCQGTEAMAQVTGTNNVSHDPMRGQPAHTGNTVEQNGKAFGGTFGSGHLEDDESNGSVITGNDRQGGDEDD